MSYMATQTLENPVIQVSGTATVEPSVEVANLCEIKDGQVVTTSLRVAEIFSKRHSDVLRDIRELDCSEDFHKRNFASMLKTTQLGNNATRKDPYYLITRDGFVFLVMGFTGKTAAKFKEAYIRAFNVMEERLRRMQSSPQYTMADAPRLVHEHLERMEAEEQPIVEFYGKQRVVSSVTLARLTGRKHDYVCDSIRAAMKWALRPSRQFYRTTRTVRKGFGKGYDYDGGIIYYVTIEGFQTMRQHCRSVTDELYKRVIADFNRNKGKSQAVKVAPSTPPKEAATESKPQGPAMPKDAADMMARFVKAMAVMMGVDVNEVSNLMNGGNK